MRRVKLCNFHDPKATQFKPANTLSRSVTGKSRKKFLCEAQLGGSSFLKNYHDPKGPTRAPNPSILPRAARPHAKKICVTYNIIEPLKKNFVLFCFLTKHGFYRSWIIQNRLIKLPFSPHLKIYSTAKLPNKVLPSDI